MTTLALPGPAVGTRWLAELDGAPVLGHVGPNWFSSVMGTGIVAVAAAGLPVAVPGLQALALATWLLATGLLVVVLAATIGHWLRHPAAARAHPDDPVMMHFLGAPAMALMTVGVGALLVGHRLVGMPAALALDVGLWTAGTLLGLATTVLVPLRFVRLHGFRPDAAFGGWLMPVVPPMVSAATGASLVPHLPAGQARTAMVGLCWSFFGLTLVTSAVMIVFVVRRLVRLGPGPAAGVPTLLIVLGPLGQSVTAAHHLGGADAGARTFTLVFGPPVLVLALVWLLIVGAVVVRTARAGLPFTLTWWSFTFPVGTVVTGTSGLADVAGDPVLRGLAVVLFAGLLAAWLVVATRTAQGVVSGRLLRRPCPGCSERREPDRERHDGDGEGRVPGPPRGSSAPVRAVQPRDEVVGRDEPGVDLERRGRPIAAQGGDEGMEPRRVERVHPRNGAVHRVPTPSATGARPRSSDRARRRAATLEEVDAEGALPVTMTKPDGAQVGRVPQVGAKSPRRRVTRLEAPRTRSDGVRRIAGPGGVSPVTDRAGQEPAHPETGGEHGLEGEPHTCSSQEDATSHRLRPTFFERWGPRLRRPPCGLRRRG